MRRCNVMVAAVVAALALVAASTPGGDKKDETPFREIDVKGISLESKGGRPTAPIVVKSAEEVKMLASMALQEALTKQIDFKKEFALVFAWAGSGGDRIVPSVAKGTDVRFLYTPGLTRDLRQHLRVFAVKTGTEWKVETGKFKFKVIKPATP